MGSQAIAMRRNQNIVTSEPKARAAGPVSVSVMLIALIIMLSLLYLNQVTKSSTFHYRISNMEKNVSELEAEKQQLEVDAARLQSMQTIKDSAASAELVPVGDVTYAK